MNSALFTFLPLGLVITWGILLLLLGAFLPNERRSLLTSVAALGAAVSGVATLFSYQQMLKAGGTFAPLGNFYVLDTFAVFFHLLSLFALLVTVLISSFYLERENLQRGEYFALLFFSVSGMMILASSKELMTLFLGLEIMSMSIYTLVGYQRASQRSNEGAFKYFLLGSLASAILLYGIALMYGVTGTTQLAGLRDYFLSRPHTPLSGLAMIFMLSGLGFKIAAVPFHTWTPDAYEGAPMPITGFMATAVKAGVFALLIRVLGEGLVDLRAYWVDLIAILAAVTMLVGNMMAFVQTSFKRMLAYSSIVHTGYLLVGVTALSNQSNNQAVSALLYYLLIYVLSSLGVFAALTLLSARREAHTKLSDYAGLASEYPFAAFALSLFMLSFIGVPPLGGFFAKYYLFATTLGAQQVLLTGFAILNSILAIAYYLRVVTTLYMQPTGEHWAQQQARPVAITAVLAITALAVFWAGFGPFNLGVFPGINSLMNWLQTASLVG